MNNRLKLILSIIGCNLIGVSGALITNPNTEWFRNLVKPSFQPPNWLFGPAWTILYTLMGIAFYLIWKDGFLTSERRQARTLFIIQLLINTSWSFVYFGMQNIESAFIVIAVLLISIIATIRAFGKVQKNAAYLLVPYLLWVSFATVLNYSLWKLN